MGQKRGPEIVKNGPRVWAFCKIEFPGIQKPVQILAQKSGFFKKCGNRGVGVIWLVSGVFWVFCCWFFCCCGVVGWIAVFFVGWLGVYLGLLGRLVLTGSRQEITIIIIYLIYNNNNIDGYLALYLMNTMILYMYYDYCLLLHLVFVFAYHGAFCVVLVVFCW